MAIVVGVGAAVFMTLVTPTAQVITNVEQRIGAPIEVPVPVTPPALGLPIAAIIVPLLFLAAGVGIGFMLRSRGMSQPEKTKNDEGIEKKKKRLAAEFTQTSDGAALEVVEDDERPLENHSF
ncbi:MAG: hypothetical protein U0694_07970 [Anaerolineae bacterium]